MKLKGIELKGSYKAEFSNEWFEVYDERGNQIYIEDSGGHWSKNEYDERGNQIYIEDSGGHWSKNEYDERDNLIYYENSSGYWSKNEYDERDNLIYYENSSGYIIDNRVKELTVEEIEKLLRYKIKVKGEKKNV